MCVLICNEHLLNTDFLNRKNHAMPSTASEIEALSDSDLSRKLKEQGVNVGPITDTTRPLFQKKLLRLLNKDVVSAVRLCVYVPNSRI